MVSKTFKVSCRLIVVLALAVAFAGCSDYGGNSASNPVSSSSSGSNSSAFNSGGAHTIDKQSNQITYEIVLLDYSYNSQNNTTFFSYSVHSNPGGVGHAIGHWVVQFAANCGGPGIIVASSETAVWTNCDPTTGIRGVKFDDGYDDDETRTVTVTLAGYWALSQTVVISVKAANNFVLGSVPGPVSGVTPPPVETYNIGGAVFDDSNSNGVMDAGEAGLSGVEVTLSDGSIANTTADGYYIFENYLPGDYTVTVTTPEGCVNTTPNPVGITITDADVTVDFGIYNPPVILTYNASSPAK